MSNQKVHIVTFNNPYPPNYGGVIDCYYKIVALSQLHVDIILHIFYDDRLELSNLEKYCTSIHLYKRDTSLLRHFSFLPFSVNSRASKQLIANINAIEAPIIFESLRCCYALKHIKLKSKKAVRCHNIEHDYSYGLSKSESSIILKLAHFIEGLKQAYFEKILNKAHVLFVISKHEKIYFSKKYKSKTVYLPAFHGHQYIQSKNGFGDYALYHGDLSVSDNIRAALFLIEVFKGLEIPLIIASSTKVNKIKTKIKKYDSISFKIIDNNDELQHLIKNAHCNIVYSFQRSGTKLKVFNALYNGRHCIVNDNVVDDNTILQLCHVANSINALQTKVIKIFSEEFFLKPERVDVLKQFNAITNAKIIYNEFFEN